MIKIEDVLDQKVVTTKVSHAAWERAAEVAEKYGIRRSDVLSIALLEISDAAIGKVATRLGGNGEKALRTALRMASKMSPEERAALIDKLRG